MVEARERRGAAHTNKIGLSRFCLAPAKYHRVPKKSLMHHQEEGAHLPRSGRQCFQTPRLHHEILHEHGTWSCTDLATSVPIRASLLPFLWLCNHILMSPWPTFLGGVLLPFPCTAIPLCLCLITLLYPLTTLSTPVQTPVSHSDIS